MKVCSSFPLKIIIGGGGGGLFHRQPCRQEVSSSSSFLAVTWILLIYVIRQSCSGTSGSSTVTGTATATATAAASGLATSSGAKTDQETIDASHLSPEFTQGLYPGPYFDVGRNTKSVSVIAGKNAYLPCYVKQLGNKTLSWIRTSDAHILTVDRFTFIADERFQIITSGDAWTLMIKSVTPNDTDYYECQISTAPKLAFRTHLQVFVPTIRINSGEDSMYVWEGSEVELRCAVQYRLAGNQGWIQWLRNDKHLNPEKNKPMYNDIAIEDTVEGTSQISTLTFHHVQFQHAGNYTCTLDNVGSVVLALHVLSGENPAAMHTISTSTASSPFRGFPGKIEGYLQYNTLSNTVLTTVYALTSKQFFTLVTHVIITLVIFLDGL